MDQPKACAYLSIECCQHSKSTIQLVKCYKCDSLLHHLCQTDYASLKGLVERDNVGEHKVCPNLSCLRTCYIINDDTSARTDNDNETPPRPTQLALPKVPPEPFLQPAGNLKKSKYWKYFWEVNSARCFGADKEFVGKARCKLCIRKPKYVSAVSGTNSLSYHLVNAHPELAVTLEATPKKKPSNDIRSFKGFEKKRKSAQEIKKLFHDSVVRWIMEEAVPFRFVEAKSFRSMINSVVDNSHEDNMFRISRSMLRARILKLGVLCKKATKEELKKYQCSFTTDHWTGPNDETYTTLTCHYISEEWENHSCVVDFKVFHGTTRGQDCGEDLFRIFDDYEFKSKNVTIIVTDTTASMITFGKTIRSERKIEHGFCVDHNLHRNCILAFDDKNLPGSERAMKTARATIEYFTKSTQAMTKLKNFQSSSMLEKYQEQKEPKKVLQDSRTRWWSTYRMLRRLRFLKEAIGGLQGANEIDCSPPTELQWDILEDVQKTLKAPAELQQVLEGESYITGSLAPFAIYKIRCGYIEAIEDDSTNESVKYLANILLKDLDERYHPTECGKVQYFRKPETGFRNRYISLHPYMFFAAFLDPRTKVKLTVMMSDDNYKVLLGDILDNMISLNDQILSDNADHETINERASDGGSRNRKRKKSPSVFDFFDSKDETIAPMYELRRTCQTELNSFEDRNVTLPFRNSSGHFNDPLSWWKSQGALRFPKLAKLAKNSYVYQQRLHLQKEYGAEHQTS